MATPTPNLPAKWTIAGVAGAQPGRMAERLSRNVGGVRYDMAPFPTVLIPSPLLGKYTKAVSIDVAARFEEAIGHIRQKCCAHTPCNDYFRSLGRGVSLSDLLDWNVYLYFWVPKERAAPQQEGSFEVVDAEVIATNPDTTYACIVVSEFALMSKLRLAATLVHELAHVAGAVGGTSDQRTEAARDRTSQAYQTLIAAEKALKSCLLTPQFSPDALGLVDPRQRHLPVAARGLA